MHSRGLMNVKRIICDLFKTRQSSSTSKPINTQDDDKHPILNKVALITGGASGIGLECAKALLDAGVKGVTIADMDKENGEIALAELVKVHGKEKALFINCDVTKSELIDWAFKNTIKTYDQLDIVVNNAGVLNDKRWETEVATNVGGYLVGNLLALQYMSMSCRGSGGIVVNISSTMGITPYSGCPIYSMTQAGILGLTRALGQGHLVDRTGVKIMALCAGLTDTNLLIKAACNTLNDKFGQEFREELKHELMQEPCVVAKALIDVICRGRPGDIFVVDKGQPPFKISYPALDDMLDDSCEVSGAKKVEFTAP